jgi:hypothetical protein
MPNLGISFNCQENIGCMGDANQRIRIVNKTNNPNWSVGI